MWTHLTTNYYYYIDIHNNISFVNTTIVFSKTLTTSLLFNSVIAVLLLLVFIIVKKLLPQVYEPNTIYRDSDHSELEQKSLFESPRGGLIGWILSTYVVTDEIIYKERGLDALMYLKVTKYLFYVSVIYCFYGCMILIPVHAFGGSNLNGIGGIGLSNLRHGSSFLYSDIIGVVFNSITSSIVLYMLYKEYARMRGVYKSDLR